MCLRASLLLLLAIRLSSQPISWIEVPFFADSSVCSIAADSNGGILVCHRADDSGVGSRYIFYSSQNDGDTWILTGTLDSYDGSDYRNLGYQMLFDSANILYVNVFVGDYGREIWTSTDFGNTWDVILSSWWPTEIPVLAIDPSSRLFAWVQYYSGDSSFLTYTNDHGVTWSQFPDHELLDWVDGIYFDDSGSVYLSEYLNQLIRTSDLGLTYDVLVDPDSIFMTPVGLIQSSAGWLLLADRSGYIWSSEDYGSNWERSDFIAADIAGLIEVNDSLHLVYTSDYDTSGSGVYLSTNLGHSWISTNDGLNSLSIRSVLVTPSNYVYLVTEENELYMTQSAVGIQGNFSSSVPVSQSLSIYPNPSNDVVRIKYKLDHQSNVHVMIYDIYGRLCWSRQHHHQSSGEYEFKWEATSVSGMDLPSGMYFVFVDTQYRSFRSKLILCR